MLTESPEKLNGDFEGKDIISFNQFDTASLDKLFSIVSYMRNIANPPHPLRPSRSTLLEGNLVYLVFYEPSSRTCGSFEAATKQLGGEAIVEKNPQQFSSVAKGETLEDTIQTFEAYSDCIVLRHPETGAAQRAADVAKYVPVINAGDGTGEHPTQAILDLYTIYERHHRLDNLIGLIAGDIKNGRTVHSLLEGLSLYPNNTVYLLSPEQLRLQPDTMRGLLSRGLSIFEIDTIEDIPQEASFWYWTRVQKERFINLDEYEQVNNKFIVTPAVLESYASNEMVLMHPLPRVGEITKNVDLDPRAVYLGRRDGISQIRNGMYTRMALLSLVLGSVH